MSKNVKIIFLFILFTSCSRKNTTFQLAALFADGMVLQRETAVDIWGSALPNTDVKIIGEWGEESGTKSDNLGLWNAKLSTPKAGGPYYLKIFSNNESFVIKDILIGEVWLASGQSNMEMSLLGYPPNDTILNYKKEILNANYPSVRMFNVEKNFSNYPKKGLVGYWREASSIEVERFSATAYFFARDIHKTLDVPVGIIHSSWGGSPCESWTSKDKLVELGFFKETLAQMKNNKPKRVIDKWFESFDSIDLPKQKDFNDRLEKEYEDLEFLDDNLSSSAYNDIEWEDVFLPGRFDSLISSNFDGVVWFRKDIFIDNSDVDYILNIGYIDDMDKTYINGNYIGGLNGWGYWNKKRKYKISKILLKQGINTIAIRAIDTGGPGRFEGKMNLTSELGTVISIEGTWKYYPLAEIYGNKIFTYGQDFSIENRPSFLKYNPFMPTVLFNRMIYPLIPYTIKGVIWYQGESNVGRHHQYSQLFPAMIEDWRSRWKNNFPFYFVQIAPYKYTSEIDSNQSQLLRDSQRKTLKLANTGMVVTLDIGDFKNIHPPNKQEVGKRLARLALVNDYGVSLNPLGPILIGGRVINDVVELKFEHVGSGLVIDLNDNNEFEIANANKDWFKATVVIEQNKIALFSQNVKNPKYVRYAWSDTPQATMFNGEGFPSSSFILEVE